MASTEKTPERSNPEIHGTTLRPPEVERAYRDSHLSEDARVAAVAIGIVTVGYAVFAVNDPWFATTPRALAAVLFGRVAFAVVGVVAIWSLLRARRPAVLDWWLVIWAFAYALRGLLFEFTRPADHFLPLLAEVAVSMSLWVMVRADFGFQVAAVGLVTAGALAWLNLFREPPRYDGWALIVGTWIAGNVGGAYVSWRMHRQRRAAYLDLVRLGAAERAALEREDELRRSAALFRAQFEDHAATKLLIDPQTGAILDANLAAAEYYGWPRERLRQMRIQEINTLSPAEVTEEIEKARTQKRHHFEFRHRRADGSIRDVEVFSSRIDVTGRELLHSIVHDITSRKQAEEALRASETLLRGITDSSPDAIFAKDRAGRSTFANPAALQAAGSTSGDVMSEADERIMESGVAQTFEEKVVGPAGTRTLLSSKAPLRDEEGRVVGIVGFAKDVTDLRNLEHRLAVASRAAAMGTLVAGLAHEINNPLAAALSAQGYALEVGRELGRRAQEHPAVDPDVLRAEVGGLIEALEDAQEGAHRIARIVRDMVAAGRPDMERARVKPSDIVGGAMRRLPAAVLEAATIQVEDRGAPDVLASPDQVEQVIVRLITNAAKATEPGRGGRIVIRIGTGGTGMALLEVLDHGVGIAPEAIPRLFDPFFTTRPVGEDRGPGLGLPICHAIVTAHGGTITVTSEAGKGSTFTVELPAATAGVQESEAAR